MGIFVHDLDRMERFYVNVFDLLVTDRGQGIQIRHDFVFMSSDPDKHHQVVLAGGRPKEAIHSTVMQISFKVDALDDLRRVWGMALANGATEMRALDHGNSWSIYFLDPEGNTIEVYLDTPFHVPQPYAYLLNLALPDAEIVAETERLCRRDPGFMMRSDFHDLMMKRLMQ
jgi:catechol 2,3-dioxygenase